MKIIHCSQKLFICALPLLLHLQPLSCMQLEPAPALNPDQQSIGQLSRMLQEHDNVDLLIDTAQKALGGMDDEDGTIHHMFEITIPARGDNPMQKSTLTHEELAQFFIDKQDQRQIYDDAFWFDWTQYSQKRYNKRLIRSNIIPITTLAYSKRCKDFVPDTAIIDNLPKRAQAIHSLDIITYLQNGFATINPEAKCLSTSVKDILSTLSTQFHFFDNPPICCGYSSAQKVEKLGHNVFLRSHIIPYCYFIERQKRINALKIAQSITPATDTSDEQQRQQASTAPAYNPYPGASVFIIGGQPPSFAEKPYPAAQFSDPFKKPADQDKNDKA